MKNYNNSQFDKSCLKNNYFRKCNFGKVIGATLLLVFGLSVSGCSGYKSSWDCPKVKGIGCSSLEYADEVAREQILLNTKKNEKKKILLKRDLLSEHEFEEAEIY